MDCMEKGKVARLYPQVRTRECSLAGQAAFERPATAAQPFLACHRLKGAGDAAGGAFAGKGLP